MAIQYKVYFKTPSDEDWIHLEDTFQLFYKLSDELQAVLDYFSIYEWRVDTYDTETELTTTGDTWTFTSDKNYSFTTYTRRSDYDENQVWEPTVGWVDIEDFEYTGGGRYNNRFIIVGHNCIYFGEA